MTYVGFSATVQRSTTPVLSRVQTTVLTREVSDFGNWVWSQLKCLKTNPNSIYRHPLNYQKHTSLKWSLQKVKMSKIRFYRIWEVAPGCWDNMDFFFQKQTESVSSLLSFRIPVILNILRMHWLPAHLYCAPLHGPFGGSFRFFDKNFQELYITLYLTNVFLHVLEFTGPSKTFSKHSDTNQFNLESMRASWTFFDVLALKLL